ncbi:hypothetical protein NMU03_14290 [Allocoprobacillus halotolerans]|uniref:DUF2156 domain-containing protein n=1 Tax=Allocoprobacillus halotolerans TaxID=2944914 RepID=A0ABY5I0C0_9FIRM|nr:hypothetical protein [Allocoprobacillus halotolerans]UTY38754.1 hypothetical protein NMU03_14290 [Allocoprobacillus halotolerans]
MKQLTLEDYSIIQPYLEKANYEGYNSNFVTMMMWNHEYHIQYEIHENFLIMLHCYKNIYFWAMPFTTPEHYKEALMYMKQYSHEHNFPFMIDCAVEDFVANIKKVIFQTNIYLKEHLIMMIIFMIKICFKHFQVRKCKKDVIITMHLSKTILITSIVI